MNTLEKFLMGAVAIGMATTLVLPDRKTPQVFDAATRFVRGVLATSMGTGKRV